MRRSSRSKDGNKERGNVTRREFAQTIAIAGAAMSMPSIWTSRKADAAPLVPTVKDPRFSVPVIDPGKIDKFRDPLPVPGGTWPILDLTTNTTTGLRIVQIEVPILPQGTVTTPANTNGLQTTVWCYRGEANYTDTFLGPTILARSLIQTQVTYDYRQVPLPQHLLKNGAGTASVVDRHLHGTDLNEPEVRFIAHLHGAKGIAQDSDGYAEAWVTPNGFQGTFPPGTSPVTVGGTQQHTYPNAQTASLAWYHDHALGITRLNVYAGGAGGYIITDGIEDAYIAGQQLPGLGIPLVIQDRMFYPDGRLAYPDLNAVAAGLIAQKDCTPWPVADVSTRPEYFGDVIVVNGKAWPYLEVDPRILRFRFLNGCNSRVLDLSFQSPQPPLFNIIGTEGGFLPGPSDVRPNLVIGGAERFDVLIDFRNQAGKTLTLINKGAKTPYPKGTPPNPQSDALVMQFRVRAGTPVGLNTPPAQWNPNTPPATGTVIRRVLLWEGRDQFGRVRPLLGTVTGAGPAFLGQAKFWNQLVTETPAAGSVEVWEIFNTTADSHPIHIHEVHFRVLDRKPIAFDTKLAAGSCKEVAPPSFPITVGGTSIAAVGYEKGFKDTVLSPPGQVTRVVVDFTGAQPGRFVWHCHILEHEDHEMMRPYDIT
jgi:spore coat protein A, manganese oxidase